MGSFAEVRSKDARARQFLHPRVPSCGSSLGYPTSRHQRTAISESEIPLFVGTRGVVCPIHPLVPFPQNHIHPSHVLWIRPPQSGGRFSGRNLTDTVSQLTSDYSPFPTKGSSGHCCCFPNALRHQSKYSSKIPCGFSVNRQGQRSDLQTTQPMRSIGGY